MVNEDVFGGLEAATARKQPLGRAMTSLLNAGYERDEIREAAMLLRSRKERPLSGETSSEKEKKKAPQKSASRVKWKSEKFKLFPEKRKFKGGKRKRLFKTRGIGHNDAPFKIRAEKRPAFRGIPDDWDRMPEEEMRRILRERENFAEKKSWRSTEDFVAREKRERERMRRIRELIILEYEKNGQGNFAR